MCESLEYLLSTGRSEGKEEGRMEGERNALVKSAKKIMNRFNYTIEETMDFLEIPLNQRNEIQALL